MPVPSVMTTTCDSPRAAPKHASAQAAALASLSTVIGQGDALRQRLAQRFVAPGQVRREDDGRAVLGDETGGADADGNDVGGVEPVEQLFDALDDGVLDDRRRGRAVRGVPTGAVGDRCPSRRRLPPRPSCRRCRCRSRGRCSSGVVPSVASSGSVACVAGSCSGRRRAAPWREVAQRRGRESRRSRRPVDACRGYLLHKGDELADRAQSARRGRGAAARALAWRPLRPRPSRRLTGPL